MSQTAGSARREPAGRAVWAECCAVSSSWRKVVLNLRESTKDRMLSGAVTTRVITCHANTQQVSSGVVHGAGLASSAQAHVISDVCAWGSGGLDFSEATVPAHPPAPISSSRCPPDGRAVCVCVCILPCRLCGSWRRSGAACGSFPCSFRRSSGACRWREAFSVARHCSRVKHEDGSQCRARAV